MAVTVAVPGSVKYGRASICVYVNKCDIARGGRSATPRDVVFSRNARRELLTSVCPVFLLPHSVTLNAALGDAT